MRPQVRLPREYDQPLLLGKHHAPMLVPFLRRSYTRYRLPQLRPNAFLLLVTVFLALQFLIPARFVIGGLGAAGRPSVVIAVVLGLTWIASWFSKDVIPVGPQPVRWIVAAFFATSLLTYAVGYSRGLPEVESSATTRQLILVTAMCGLAVAIADGIPDRRTLDSMLRRLTHFAGVMAAVGVVQSLFRVNPVDYIRIPGLQLNASLVGIADRGSLNVARVAGTASHFIEFGVVLAMITPIAVHYAMQSRGRSVQIRRWGLTLLIASGVPLSVSRSAVISLAVSMIFLAIVWTWRTKIMALIVGFVAMGAFYALRPAVISTIRSLFRAGKNEPSVQARIEDYPTVERYFLDRPWFGRGLGTFLPREYTLLDNELLNTLVADGLVGLAAFLILFVGGYFMGRSIRHHGVDDSARQLGQVLAGSLVAALVASATFDSMTFPTFVGVLFMLIGAVGALFRLCRVPAPPSPNGDFRAPPPDSLPPVIATSLYVRWTRLLRIDAPGTGPDRSPARQQRDGLKDGQT